MQGWEQAVLWANCFMLHRKQDLLLWDPGIVSRTQQRMYQAHTLPHSAQTYLCSGVRSTTQSVPRKYFWSPTCRRFLRKQCLRVNQRSLFFHGEEVFVNPLFTLIFLAKQMGNLLLALGYVDCFQGKCPFFTDCHSIWVYAKLFLHLTRWLELRLE